MSDERDMAMSEKLEVAENAETVKIEEKVVYEPYVDNESRSLAIHEVEMLCNMINAHYYYIHTDAGNHGKQEPKLTKSTAISVFSGQQIDSFTQRIAEINNRLVQKS